MLDLLNNIISRCRSSFLTKFCLNRSVNDIVGLTNFDGFSSYAEVVDKLKLILVSKTNDYCTEIKNDKLKN